MTAIEFSSQLLSLEQSLLKFAYRLNLKKPDAKDLLQETYLKVLINREKYTDNQNFKSWTFTIMKNTFIDNYRHTFRNNTHNDQNIDSLAFNFTEPAASDDPASAYSAQEINQNIDHLEEKLRLPFKMYVNGYKYTEIADELKLKIGTVKNRIFLSRKHLITQLNR